MSIQWTVFAIWAAGMLTSVAWMYATKRPKQRAEILEKHGYSPTGTAFLAAALAASACWPIIPALRLIVRWYDREPRD